MPRRRRSRPRRARAARQGGSDQGAPAVSVFRIPYLSETSRQIDVEGVEGDVADALEELGGPGVGQGLGQTGRARPRIRPAGCGAGRRRRAHRFGRGRRSLGRTTVRTGSPGAGRSRYPPPRPRKRPRLPSAAWHRILTGGSRARVFQPSEYILRSGAGYPGPCPGPVCGSVSLAPV